MGRLPMGRGASRPCSGGVARAGGRAARRRLRWWGERGFKGSNKGKDQVEMAKKGRGRLAGCGCGPGRVCTALRSPLVGNGWPGSHGPAFWVVKWVGVKCRGLWEDEAASWGVSRRAASP